jgi:hypothetical protein
MAVDTLSAPERTQSPLGSAVSSQGGALVASVTAPPSRTRDAGTSSAPRRTADSARSAPPCHTKNNSPRDDARPAVRGADTDPEGVPPLAFEDLCRTSTALLRRWVREAPWLSEEAKAYAKDAPRSVLACMLGLWSMVTLSRETGECVVQKFRCKSWRCPFCRFTVAKQDYARILEGLGREEFDASEWLFVTLTFDRVTFANPFEAYVEAGKCFYKLLMRLRRRYGVRVGGEQLLAEIGYLAVWERTLSGWPHVHVLFRSRDLCNAIRRLGRCVKDVDGYGPQRWDPRVFNPQNPQKRGAWVPNWAWKARVLEDLCEATGFGRVSDVQFPRASEGGVAYYVTKLSGEVVGVNDQRPVNAPRGFRRLRTSKGMLPHRHRPDGTVTGELVQARASRLSRRLDWSFLANRPRRPAPKASRWRTRPNRVRSVGNPSRNGGSRLTPSSARPQVQELPLPPPPPLPDPG